MKIKRKKSPVAGYGIFALSDIAQGESIGIFEGKIVPDTEESYQQYDENYLLPVSDSRAIVVSNILKYTNHSCDPNSGFKTNRELVAMRRIKAGEEITFDYDMLEYDWKMKCHCIAAQCRKETKGYKYLSSRLRKKYRGFITPYLLENQKQKDKNVLL